MRSHAFVSWLFGLVFYHKGIKTYSTNLWFDSKVKSKSVLHIRDAKKMSGKDIPGDCRQEKQGYNLRED